MAHNVMTLSVPHSIPLSCPLFSPHWHLLPSKTQRHRASTISLYMPIIQHQWWLFLFTLQLIQLNLETVYIYTLMCMWRHACTSACVCGSWKSNVCVCAWGSQRRMLGTHVLPSFLETAFLTEIGPKHPSVSTHECAGVIGMQAFYVGAGIQTQVLM